MKTINVLYVLILLCLPQILFSQEPENAAAVEQAIEIAAQQSTENIDLEYLRLQLEEYIQKPIDLNRCSLEELGKFPVLNPLQKNDLLNHRKNYGDFLNWNEVLRIKSISYDNLLILQNFATLQDGYILARQTIKQDLRRSKKEISFTTRRKFPTPIGYEPEASGSNKYFGSPWKNQLRLRIYKTKSLSAFIGLDKDPGENFVRRGKLEFYTIHASRSWNTNRLRKLIIGDHHIRAGQDLVLGPPFAFSKSANLGSVYRSGPILRPNTSLAENGYRRGVATQWKFGEMTAAFSIGVTPKDARLDSLGNATSFPLAGYHRNISEYATKNKAREFHLAGLVDYKINRHKIGISFLHRRLSTKAKNDSASQYAALGLHHKFQLGKGIVFGETGVQNEPQTLATLQGALFSLTPQLSFASVFRYYPENWSNPSGNAFTAQSRNRNELGFYAGFEFKFNNKWSINWYLDQYKNLNPDRNTQSQTWKQDILGQINFTQRHKTSVYFRVRHRIHKEDTEIENAKIAIPDQEQRTNLRIHFTFSVHQDWEISYRVAYNFNQFLQTKSNGRLVFQDIKYKGLGKSFAVNFRIALFHAPRYASRIYAYENDLLYSFSIPAYSGIGQRYYAKFSWNIHHHLKLWLRWSQSVFTNQLTSGSGGNEIENNFVSEVAILLRYKF